MSRYTRVHSVTFGQTDLPLPLSVRLSRSAPVRPAGGETDAYATSVQLATTAISAEVRIRDTAVAESLTLGSASPLSFTVRANEGHLASRDVTIAGAVLVGVELSYGQSALAVATLRFQAEAADGGTDPFAVEDSQ